MARLIGWIKCWWHCLTHFHRMAYGETTDFGMHTYSETTWIGCGDCDYTAWSRIKPRVTTEKKP